MHPKSVASLWFVRNAVASTQFSPRLLLRTHEIYSKIVYISKSSDSYRVFSSELQIFVFSKETISFWEHQKSSDFCIDS